MVARLSIAARRVGIAAGFAVIVATGAAGVQALRIHHQDGQWALAHPPAPKRLQFKGHTYERASKPRMIVKSSHDKEWPSVDLVLRGTTPGGGFIFTPSTGPDLPPVIWVQEHAEQSRAWQYELADTP